MQNALHLAYRNRETAADSPSLFVGAGVHAVCCCTFPLRDLCFLCWRSFCSYIIFLCRYARRIASHRPFMAVAYRSAYCTCGIRAAFGTCERSLDGDDETDASARGYVWARTCQTPAQMGRPPPWDREVGYSALYACFLPSAVRQFSTAVQKRLVLLSKQSRQLGFGWIVSVNNCEHVVVNQSCYACIQYTPLAICTTCLYRRQAPIRYVRLSVSLTN